MTTAANVLNNVKASYTIAIMGVLGVVAFVSAVLIAWPALPISVPRCSTKNYAVNLACLE